jgi:hypothetical protein
MHAIAVLRSATHRSRAVPHTSTAAPGGTAARKAYLAVLTWAFTVFNSVRMASYVPTVLAIHASGDSSQHSLWTWGTWLGANLTMAAWLYEQNGQRLGRAAIVSLGNAAMCAVTVAVIAAHRPWTF